ncbi:hypothetical protein J41TS2_24950 [Bacillus sonorensis]|uniref:hypothetical protein n=1 Tax=Bacillus sonorensis TaxID=119858 RepID=UPI001B00C260|nr:hypothetical protein [Bacillus sonorensis]GIN67074.1 hypothetical protein J41TS2_24950 [Bacillus sonorensis]
MNPDYKVDNKLIYTFNGVPITEMESVKTAQVIHRDKEIKNGEDFAIYNKETTVRIENVQFDEGRLILPRETTFTAIGIGYKFPRGKGFPKKKRIRKKWMKKYSYEFELKDCMIF